MKPKKTILMISVFIIILSGLQTAFAQATSEATCTLNGQPVPCSELAKQMGGILGGIGIFFLVFFILAIAGFVFWLIMLIHAASKPIENKALWIVLLVFTGLIGAIVYYFIVKRPFDKVNKPLYAGPSVPPVQPVK